MNTQIKTCITWNGQGGKLDSTVVLHNIDDDEAVSRALVKMISGGVVNAGDTFEIQDLSGE